MSTEKSASHKTWPEIHQILFGQILFEHTNTALHHVWMSKSLLWMFFSSKLTRFIPKCKGYAKLDHSWKQENHRCEGFAALLHWTCLGGWLVIALDMRLEKECKTRVWSHAKALSLSPSLEYFIWKLLYFPILVVFKDGSEALPLDGLSREAKVLSRQTSLPPTHPHPKNSRQTSFSINKTYPLQKEI